MDPAFSCEFCGVYMGDEDKEPRVLCCGHTFCTPCVCDFFRWGKYKCPSCSRQHHPENTDTIPVNHSLLKMIKAEKSPGDKKRESSVSSPGLSKKDGTSSDPETETNLPMVNPGLSEEPFHHAGKCDKHDAYCTFWCKKCKEWICHNCTVIGHPPAQCDICSFGQAVEEMKIEEDLCIKRTVELFDTHAEKYHKKQWALKAQREKHRGLIKELQRLLSKHQRAKRDIEKRAEVIKSCLANGLTTLLMLLESQGRLLEARTLEEVLDARHQAQVCQSNILAWHDPAILVESEEMYYSEELQNSTSTALAVLRHTLSSSDNSPSSDFTTLSTEDEAEVARNLKYLMESPEWKRIVEKRENDDLATDNSWWHCLAKASGKTDTRKDELDKSLSTYNKTSDQQLEVKSPSPRKRYVPVECSNDSCTEDTDHDCRCSHPHKQHMVYDDLKGLVYSRSMHPQAKRRASLSPKLDQISENEELVEGLIKEPEKHVEGEGLDHHPQLSARRRIGFTEGDSKQIVSREGLQMANNVTIPLTDGVKCTETNTEAPGTSLPAVAESEPTYPEQEVSSRENSLLEDSRNELHLFYYVNGGFENAPETEFGSHGSGTDKGCNRKSDSGKNVVGNSASAGNESAGNSASAENESSGNSASAGNESSGNSASTGNESSGNSASAGDDIGNSASAGNESAGNSASAGNIGNSASAGNNNVGNSASAGNDNVGNSASAGNESTGSSASDGNESTSNSASAGNDNVGNSASAGSDNIGNSASAGNESSGNSASAGKDNVGNSASDGNESTGNSASAGNESTGNSASAGNESTGNSASDGNESTGNPASAGNESTGNSASDGNESIGNSASAGNDNVGNSASAGNESTDNSASAGNESTGNPASDGNESTGNPASAENESTGNPASAGNESTGNPASAGNESIGNSASDGNESIGNSASAGNDNVGNFASAGNDNVGNFASAGSDNIGNSASAGNDNVGNTASGSVCVVAGEAEEEEEEEEEDEDDYDCAHYFDSDYYDDASDFRHECDSILSSLSEERENGTEQTERKLPNKKLKPRWSSLLAEAGNGSGSFTRIGKNTNGSIISSDDTDLDVGSDDEEGDPVRLSECIQFAHTLSFNYKVPGSSFHCDIEDSLRLRFGDYNQYYFFPPGRIFQRELNAISRTDRAGVVTVDCPDAEESQTEVACGSAESEKITTTADVQDTNVKETVVIDSENTEKIEIHTGYADEEHHISNPYGDTDGQITGTDCLGTTDTSRRNQLGDLSKSECKVEETEEGIIMPQSETEVVLESPQSGHKDDDKDVSTEHSSVPSKDKDLGNSSATDCKSEEAEEGMIMPQSETEVLESPQSGHKDDDKDDFSTEHTSVTSQERHPEDPSATACKAEETGEGIITPQSETEVGLEIPQSGHKEDAQDSSIQEEQSELEVAGSALKENEGKVNKSASKNKRRFSGRCRVT